MPFKLCPACGQKCGVRTLTCKCGSSFAAHKPPTIEEHKLSMGSWVDDMPKGMKKPEVPEPMETFGRRLSNEEVREAIAYEGLGFSVFTYIPPARIDDKVLAQKWLSAKNALREIMEYLYE